MKVLVEMVETLSHVANILTALATIVAPPAIAVGLVARLGPVRAVTLALGTRFRRAQVVSQRASEVRTLRSMLSTVLRDQFVVVTGPKGIG